MIKKWIAKLDEYFSKDEQAMVLERDATIRDLKRINGQKLVLIKDLELQLEKRLKEKEELRIALNQSYEENENKVLEYFWTHRINPRKNYNYPARDGNYMNVLKFLNIRKNKVTLVDGYDADTIADNAMLYVRRYMKYVSEPGENWQYANETLERKKGDCEDGAILIANIMILSGVPYWRVRINVGNVKGGYHAYITYLREKDGEWYVLDWCYWPNESQGFKMKWKDAEKKYFDIDWSFDKNNAYIKDNMDR